MSENPWLELWRAGETRWHQNEIEPNLISSFTGVAPTRVFVPLCGKSLDMLWLADQGHRVVGVELSELGCRAFFEENRLAISVSERMGMKVFRSGLITLINGDIFDLTSEILGEVGAVYDRAALIALPGDSRDRYAQHLKSLLRSCMPKLSCFLQIVLERSVDPGDGPPYSVSATELERLYGDVFRVEQVSKEVLSLSGQDPERVTECVYWLSPKL